MEQQDRRPQKHQLVVEVAEDEDGHVIGGQVRQPEHDAEHGGRVATPDARCEDLQGETDEDQDLDLPFVPQMLRVASTTRS